MTLDRMGNLYLSPLYFRLTPGERLAHFQHVGARIRHKKEST